MTDTVLAASRANRYGTAMFTTHALRVAILFAIAGIVGRFLLRYVETRWQIVAFWCVVIGYQLLLRPMRGRRVSIASTLLDLIAVTAAIVATKVAIEGHL